MKMGNKPLIYCAIDTYSLDIALTLSKKVVDAGCGIKLGMEFYNSLGPYGVNKIKDTLEFEFILPQIWKSSDEIKKKILFEEKTENKTNRAFYQLFPTYYQELKSICEL